MQFQNPATFTYCLSQSYTAHPTPNSAPRCTEAESRMEQSCARWQWHPSHAMNNQWTPSGAYNRGAQLQSLTPGCLSLLLSLALPNAQSLTFSRFLSPVFSSVLSQFSPHIIPLRSYCLAFSHHLLFFSIYFSLPCLPPTTVPHAPQGPLWQASHGFPHSNSVVQIPDS